ncbi:MAG: asparagine synthase (glutamine-hydrolyzing) [Acidobacteriaceae bacterium]|nr:asparagine synthase (glutamine-hydrolyzing) [Acidobacteriaceae bacterium]
MCGIAGFTHFKGTPAHSVLRQALDSIRHRGPNQCGVFESSDASLGAVRLKIIDLHGGDQPIALEGGDLVVVFNGEIYNHVELRRELEALGHRFSSHCDTEVVLHAFAEWDVRSFERLRGMFAIALWQPSRKRLVLARDRLGIKPLYYTTHRGELYFGSELKAIFAHPDISRRLSETAFGYFLSLNYVPTPYTLVEGIEKLLPGTWLEFRDGALKSQHYWRNEFRPQSWTTTDAAEQLDDLLRKSIAEHLISDVPLGIWASGGLDSSAILHYAAQAARQKLKTFSISFAGRRFDESRYFRLLAETYNTEHHEFDLNSDVDLTSAIHEIAYYSDEPSADAGALPVWFLSRMTAQHVTVALSGEGADEVFGGYQTYLADRYAQRIRHAPAFLLRTALNIANRLPVSDEKIGLEYKLKRFLAGALLSADNAHFYWNGTFSKREQRELGLGRDPQPLERLSRALTGLPPASDVINRFLFVDQHYYLPDDILYKCDRMSMAHSLEVRPPFLDHRIVEFAGTLPAHLKINGKKTKFIMRELLHKKLPAPILQRRKEGLDIPAHDWLRGPLKPLLMDALGPESVKRVGIFSSAAISRLVHQHLNREANLGYHLWGLLTLHLWMKRWKINSGSLPEDMAIPQPATVYVNG